MLNAFCESVQAYLDEVKARTAREMEARKKRKEIREMKKSLRSSGFEERWCKVETGMLGSATVDILIDGKMHTFEGTLVSSRDCNEVKGHH